jgi:hypothetical protein
MAATVVTSFDSDEGGGGQRSAGAEGGHQGKIRVIGTETGVAADGDEVDESRVGAGVKIGEGEIAIGVGGDGLREERGGGGAIGGGADGVKLDDGSRDGLLAAVDMARDLDRCRAWGGWLLKPR